MRHRPKEPSNEFLCNRAIRAPFDAHPRRLSRFPAVPAIARHASATTNGHGMNAGLASQWLPGTIEYHLVPLGMAPIRCHVAAASALSPKADLSCVGYRNELDGAMKKSLRIRCAAIVGLLTLPLWASAAEFSLDKGGMDETGPYVAVEDWFKPGFERWNQPVTSVAVDRPDRIFVVAGDESVGPPGSPVWGPTGKPLGKTPQTPDPTRATTHEHLILVLNAQGEVIEDWKQWNDQIVMPHNVILNPYDPKRHVWVVDREGHQILKFTNDGKKLALKLGEKGVPGTDQRHFDKPAGLAFLPDGSFYVADGYSNARVIKFDKAGKFQLEWGKKGTGVGEFNLVHSIAVDAQRRVYVADRSNSRIQIFDENGKFLDAWTHIRGANHLLFTEDGSLWVTSGFGNRLAKYDSEGRLQTYWGMGGAFPGGLNNPHGISIDAAQNVYVADSFNNRVQKFQPYDAANKSRLIGAPLLLSQKAK